MNAIQNYFLESTCDKTDRSEEIEAKLKEFGVCILGSGTFTVRGIAMPPHSTLMGLGECSVLLLDESVAEGYAVRMNTYCTVKNLTLKGSEENISRPETLGTRHGIGFLGNATPKAYGNQPIDGIIESCRIRFFSGGGITCTDTGYSPSSSLCVSNCRIRSCGAGLNISHFSEYHKFTNVCCNANLFGCINNGGNNVFQGCSFDCNTMGFLIDNREKQSPNNAHGSAVGCTFNHTDSNRGVGIRILGSTPGYVFSACQIFFSAIEIENSKGILLDGCNFGRQESLRFRNSDLITLQSCVFSEQLPTFEIENSPSVKIENCYTRAGEPILLPEA